MLSLLELDNEIYLIHTFDMNERIINLIILFHEYKAGPDSIKIKSRRKGLSIVTDEGESFIKGRWRNALFVKYLKKIGKIKQRTSV